MKFRVIACPSNPGMYAKKEQLKTLHQSSGFVIQGDDDIRTLHLEDGREAFLAGNLLGMRTSTGEMMPCFCASASLKELIQTNKVEQCRAILEGRFLLAVAGPGDTCRVCADRYGQFDLYYQPSSSPKVFASDLSLLPVSPAQDGFDQPALAYALTVYGNRPPKKHTPYKGVCRLGIGESVYIDQGKAEVVTAAFVPISTRPYGERELNQYADLLLDAIQIRGSRYGNAVSLSSGWDSTSILACLVHIFGASKVRAVTGRMLYAERSGVINQFEIDRAKAIANYFGIALDIVDYDYRHKGPEWVEGLGPFLRSHSIYSISSVSQAILYDFVARTTKGDETLFVGEISDGAHNLGFSQFVTIFHPVLSFREYSDKMASYLFGPSFLSSFRTGQFLTDPVYNIFRSRAGSALFDEPSTDGPRARTLQLLSSFFLRATRLPLWSLGNSRMLSPKGAADLSEKMESIYLRQAADALTSETLYSWYLHLYNSFHWQSSMIASRSLLGEEKGLKIAMPFWDSRIQEFLSSMPEEWGRGLDLNPTKYPLKWMLKHRIDYPMHLQVGPHSYLYDVDPSFSHAAEITYGSAFALYFKELLRARSYQAVLDPEYFNLGYIDNIVKRYLDDTEVRGAELSDLFSLCMLRMGGWYSQQI